MAVLETRGERMVAQTRKKAVGVVAEGGAHRVSQGLAVS